MGLIHGEVVRVISLLLILLFPLGSFGADLFEKDFVNKVIKTPTPTAKEKQVLSIGLIISGVDKGKLFQELLSLKALTDKFSIPLYPVYLFIPADDLEWFTKELGEKEEYEKLIVSLSHALKFVEKVPDRFKVTKSPSFLVNTVDGIYVFEGERNILQHFTENGAFIMPIKK